MLKRLLVGLVLGIVIGGAAAAVVLKVFGAAVFPNAIAAYAAAAITGLVAGLIAGKPIWSQDGRIEAGLKAFFGALLACGGMFALRTWVHASFDLQSFGAGAGSVADLPVISLPAIAVLLAGFFELDNTPEAGDGAAKSGGGASKAALPPKTRIAEPELEDELEEPVSAKKRKR